MYGCGNEIECCCDDEWMKYDMEQNIVGNLFCWLVFCVVECD